MIGVIDVGGGMRGIYGAGIFDYCLEEKIDFDYCIGVSAGSANCASYVAKQAGRNIPFYTVYNFRKEYMSFGQFIKTGNYLNLEYIYGYGLSNSDAENPLDYETMIGSDKIFKIVATDAKTGKPIYYDMHDMDKDDYGAIKGSSCVPVAAKAYEWKGKKLYDGGLSDPIPFQKALDDGCDKLVIILTRPRDYRRESKKDKFGTRLIKRKYPNAAAALALRAETYNKELDMAIELEKEGKVLILAPSDISGMKTLTKDKDKIMTMYKMGKKDACAIKDFMGKN